MLSSGLPTVVGRDEIEEKFECMYLVQIVYDIVTHSVQFETA